MRLKGIYRTYAVELQNLVQLRHNPEVVGQVIRDALAMAKEANHRGHNYPTLRLNPADLDTYLELQRLTPGYAALFLTMAARDKLRAEGWPVK